MTCLPRFVRLAAAAAILLSTFAVVGVAPSGALPSPSGSAVANGNTGTATITYAGTSDFQVYIIDGASTCQDTGGQPTTGILGTIGVDSPAPASPFTVTTETIVGPSATALGTGSFLFCLYDETEGWTLLEPASTIAIFVPMTSSFVTNSDGTITITYANANSDFGQAGALLLAPGVTECPVELFLSITTGFAFQLGTPDSPLVAGTPSGTVIGVGTLALKLPIVSMEGFTPQPVTEGLYQVCLYQPDSEGNAAIHQSASFFVREVPVEPVTPAFTG